MPQLSSCARVPGGARGTEWRTGPIGAHDDDQALKARTPSFKWVFNAACRSGGVGIELATAPSGLKWKKAVVFSPAEGEESKPTQGRELENANLAEALLSKREFTSQEWTAFGIGDLRFDDFIKSGQSYFKPATPHSEVSRRCQECSHLCPIFKNCSTLLSNPKSVHTSVQSSERDRVNPQNSHSFNPPP